MALTHSQRQRQTRQEALREQLKGASLLQQYVDTIQDIVNLKETDEQFTNSLAKLKTINEQRARLINKVLPDEKFIEIAGELNGKVTVKVIDLSGSADDDD